MSASPPKAAAERTSVDVSTVPAQQCQLRTLAHPVCRNECDAACRARLHTRLWGVERGVFALAAFFSSYEPLGVNVASGHLG